MQKTIAVVMIGLVVAGIFIYTELTAKPVIQNGLTKRSKEYIEKQSKNNDAFRYANLTNGKDADRSGKVVVDDCFSFNIPFSITHNRQDAECEVTYGISGGGNVIAYKRNADIGSFDSVPGVSLRRLEKEKYKEERKVLNGKTYLVFTAKDEQIKNAFYFGPGFYFVLNLLAPYSTENDGKFMKMLESVEFN